MKPPNVAKMLKALVDQVKKNQSSTLYLTFNGKIIDSEDEPKRVVIKSAHLVKTLERIISLELEPKLFVIEAAKTLLDDATQKLLFGDEAKKTKGLINNLGEEGIEILCNRVNDAVQNCELSNMKEVSSSVQESTKRKKGDEEESKKNSDAGNAEKVAEEKVEEKVELTSGTQPKIRSKRRFRKKLGSVEYDVFPPPNIKLDLPEDHDRVTSGELVKFEKFVSEIDRNPRRLKRIVNTYQLITEVAKKRPIAEENPEKVVYDDERWLPFTPKLIKWICLCECYPYRMSLLVLIIEDFEQKGAMNDIIEERLKTQPGIESELVQWYDRTDENEPIKVTTSLQKDKLISTVYFRYVDRFVFAHKLSDKMLRLDSDAEQFTKLLMMPCTDDGSDITVGDIIGLIPDRDEDGDKALSGTDASREQRYDSNFSLLSFSFNLNTAMRAQLGSERSGFLSESELCFGGTADRGAAEAVHSKTKRM